MKLVELELLTRQEHQWSQNCLPVKSTSGVGTTYSSRALVESELLTHQERQWSRNCLPIKSTSGVRTANLSRALVESELFTCQEHQWSRNCFCNPSRALVMSELLTRQEHQWSRNCLPVKSTSGVGTAYTSRAPEFATSFMQFCVVHLVYLYVFLFCIPCCAVCYDFHIKLCCLSYSHLFYRGHVSFVIVFIYDYWCPTQFPYHMMFMLFKIWWYLQTFLNSKTTK